MPWWAWVLIGVGGILIVLFIVTVITFSRWMDELDRSVGMGPR